MPYNSYDINFYKLSDQLTPRWLRKVTFRILLRACLYPLVLIHNAFIRYRNAKLYEISMNYQVCYLEAFLNDRFDFSLRRIHIDDAATVDALYLYLRDEEKPLNLYIRSEDHPVYLHTRGETLGDMVNDFIIWVPADIIFSEAEMRAMIATKLCGKRYKIETF